jgi:nucleoid-associated protein YgaU
MEPAMALCAGLAAITLGLGAIGSLPADVRRLGAIRLPMPVRPIAAIVLLASLLVPVNWPRSVGASVPPPIVRLSDQAVADEHPQKPPEPSTSSATSRFPGAGSTAATYLVRPGDSLWRIAERTLADRHGGVPMRAEIARFWPRIYETNRALVGANPDLIFPGQHLEIPEA